MGMHGTMSSLGMAFGPALGSWIADTFSMNVLFYVSSMFALVSIAILYNMKETLPKSQQEKFSLNSLKITKEDIFDKMVKSRHKLALSLGFKNCNQGRNILGFVGVFVIPRIE